MVRLTIKHFILSLSLSVFFLFKSQAITQIIFYASPTGNGSICSEAHPGSLVSVREKIRTINSHMSCDITVLLRGGTYFLTESFNLGTLDGGTNNCHIIYQPYKNEKPVFSGGKQISGWTLHDKVRNIYKAHVGNIKFRQLYINGVRTTRARTPNRDGDEDFGPFYNILGWDYANWRAKVNGNELENWKNMNQVEMVAKNHWKHCRFRIKDVEWNSTDAFIYAMDEEKVASRWHNGHMMDDHATFFFENAFEFLDTKGEWYLNTFQQTLYYIPRDGENLNTTVVIVPTLETLLNIKGASPLNPVCNIRFSGITFEYTTWLLPSLKGLIDVQGCYKDCAEYESCPDHYFPGMVHLENATGINIENCKVQHAGAQGIVFVEATTANKINRVEIFDVSADGIVVDAGGHQNGGGSVDDTIMNCTIHATGRDYSGGGYGIIGIWPTRCVIEHNEVYNCPATGIGIGWGWLNGPSALKGNKICFNNIHNVVQLHDDNGGIYTMSWQPGTIIFENWIHDITHSEWTTNDWAISAIYLDNFSSFIRVEHNVITRVRTKPNETSVPFLQGYAPPHDNIILHNDTQDQSVIDNAGPFKIK